MKNYIKLRNRVPFRSTFMYIDSCDYVCDELFFIHGIYHGLRFFKQEFYKEGSEFVLVLCSIFTKDIPKFEECMEHLRRKIEFLDYDIEEYDTYSVIFEVVEDNTLGELII